MLSAAGGGEKNARRGTAVSIHVYIRRRGRDQGLGADAAVAVALSATLRRMYERKEDMRPAVGGSVVIGTGPVSTSMPTPVVEAAVAVEPAMVSTVASRKGEAFRIVTAEVAVAVASSAASEGTVGKRGAELPPAPVSR